jgi:hypothetical protein
MGVGPDIPALKPNVAEHVVIERCELAKYSVIVHPVSQRPKCGIGQVPESAGDAAVAWDSACVARIAVGQAAESLCHGSILLTCRFRREDGRARFLHDVAEAL